MFDLSGAQLERLVIHKVGNKLREEGFIVAGDVYRLTDGNVEELLLKYFLSSFKDAALYKFAHDTDIHLNELYMYVSKIFIDRDSFYEQSVHILQHLYEQSSHPKVKSGEFYVTYLSGCIVEGQTVEGIGLFKTEHKDTYLKVTQAGNDFVLGYDDGINVKKLDKGCIIFNYDSVEGYRIALVDNANKNNNEAQYWKDGFLRVVTVQDGHFHTEETLALCKDFAENVYGPLYQADKKDQVALVNQSIQYFTKHEEFDIDDFAAEVIREPELIEQFKSHKEDYDMNQGRPPVGNFTISLPAVRNAKRQFKNLIKLDTGVEIHLKGMAAQEEGLQYIERDFDAAKGLHFYKLYFGQEE